MCLAKWQRAEISVLTAPIDTLWGDGITDQLFAEVV
jgi:hypothetical protein